MTVIQRKMSRAREVYANGSDFVNDDSHIRGFAARLDRYLSGGSWEGADEGGAMATFLADAWRAVRNWVRRR